MSLDLLDTLELEKHDRLISLISIVVVLENGIKDKPKFPTAHGIDRTNLAAAYGT